MSIGTMDQLCELIATVEPTQLNADEVGRMVELLTMVSNRNITPWRDYIENLTEKQIAWLEKYEAEGDPPKSLTAMARSFAEENAVNARFAHIPLPAGAVTGDGWIEYTEGHFTRELEWGSRTTCEAVVCVMGRQSVDGQFNHRIAIYFDNGDDVSAITPTGARELAAALLEAADEDEGLVAK